MAKPNSRATFIDYCLRVLGHPVIEINVDDDQVEDRVDDALQYYQEYHGDAVVRNLRKHLLTSTDVVNGYIEIPNSSNVLSINNVFSTHTSNATNTIFSIDYQLHLNDIFDLNGVHGGIVNYEITKQYMSLIDRNINGMYELIEFSRHKNRVNFHSNTLKNLDVGNYIVLDGYEAIDPDTYVDVWNDMFLKKYATALMKRQWGTNLKKFEGMTLPGGVTFNGQTIFDEANEEITKLEEEMQLRHEMPPHFFIG